MIRSLVIKRASQIEPSLNVKVHLEVIDRLADEQPDKLDTILLDIFGRCDELPTRLVRGQLRQEDYSLFPFPTSVERLVIADCAITDTVLQNYLRNSGSLTWLFLSGLPFITSIPSEVMKSLTMLQELFIISCAQITCLQGLNHLSSFRSLDISQCPNLMMDLKEDEKLRVLRALTTDDIHLVPQLLSREGFTSLQSLTFRFVGSEEQMEEEMLAQFSSLTSLSLCSCMWNRLPENLANLTCLQELRLHNCKNIMSLPTLPVSLRGLILNACDQSFVKSSQKVGHPNYQKIAHVPSTPSVSKCLTPLTF
uniref:NB-ARC domain-containing protein n=1 Tax=Oryza rufipogon TaxID=4529 RepID=A0A0E0P4H8_ORYRU